MAETIIDIVKASREPITPKLIAKKAGVKRCVVHAILCAASKKDTNLKVVFRSPCNNMRKRPVWMYTSIKTLSVASMEAILDEGTDSSPDVPSEEAP